MCYSHRNGERQAPEKEGFYWFSGVERPGSNYPHQSIIWISVGVENTVAYPTWIEGWMRLYELDGEWWGPLRPPWEDVLNEEGSR